MLAKLATNDYVGVFAHVVGQFGFIGRMNKGALKTTINWKKAAAYAPLEHAQVHVWAAVLDQSHELRPAFTRILSSDEIERARRFQFARDRASFTSSRTMLRCVLGHYLRIGPAEVRFEYSPSGKPAVANETPGPPLHFNLSQSDGLTLLALTRACPLGIDVERINEVEDLDSVAGHFFSPYENAALRALPRRDKIEAFYDLWTRKEARLKATGEGIAHSLKRTEVLFPNEGRTEVKEARRQTVSLTGWTLQQLEPAAGFKAALAYPRSDLSILTWQWSDELHRL
jgi:4'-phosphopantetheinyl transferase